MNPVVTSMDFYFDFISPYAYLAHHKLIDMASRRNVELVYHPLDLAQAKLAAGNTAPPNRDLPVKLAYLLKDLARWATRYDIPIFPTSSRTSERFNVGTFYAMDRGATPRYVQEVWRRTLGAGGDLGSPALQRDVAAALGWNPDEFIAAIDSTALRARYAQSNRDAQARGVFGVPTMMIGQEMWWGNDRLQFVEEYLDARTAAVAQ